MSAPKKRRRDSASGVISGKASGGESVFVGHEVYVNRIPDPPCEGKMLREGDEVTDVVSYKPTQLETRYRYPLLEDSIDSGLNFDLVDVVSWESPWVRLEATMPPFKRQKHSETDSSPTASVSSYYQHYQKKKRADISANALAAAKHGRVAAPDVTLPFESQMRAIPKPQLLPLYHRDTISSTSTTISLPSSVAVPWLKRTEYITAKDERSFSFSDAIVTETLDQFDAIMQKHHLSAESPSSTTMDVDSQEERDEDDRMVDEILASPSPSSQPTRTTPSRSPSSRNITSRSPVARDSTASPSIAVGALLQNPFHTNATQVLRQIERSFNAIASRSSIVHPSEVLSGSKSTALRRSSSIGAPASQPSGPYIVEEWDVFPNDLVWPNHYVILQPDLPLPKSEASVIVPSALHEPSLLKPPHTEADHKASHDAHVVPQRKPEILTVYAKPEGEDDPILGGTSLEEGELAFHSHWEAEATTLRPEFDTVGSFVFVLGPTAPYDADEDEESGISYEGETSGETVAARRNKNQSLVKARVGTATYKNVEARVHLRPPTAEARAMLEKTKTPTRAKPATTDIPDLEMYLRTKASQSVK